MNATQDKGGWNPQSPPVEQHEFKKWTATFLEPDGDTYLMPICCQSIEEARQIASRQLGTPGSRTILADIREGFIDPKYRAAHDAAIREAAAHA